MKHATASEDRLSRWRWCVTVAVLLLVGSVAACDSVGGCVPGGSGPQPHLPAFSPALEECPHEQLIVQQWIGQADGVIFGQIAEIVPMTEKGWRHEVEGGESRIAGEEVCEGDRRRIFDHLRRCAGLSP